MATSKTYRAKLFQNGGSQAIRLPKEFRLPGLEVVVSRGEGDRLVIEPTVRAWTGRFLETVRTTPAAKLPLLGEEP